MQKQILLIDDDTDEFEFLRMALDLIPGIYQCSYASNVHAAIESAREFPPDYILIDMNMPAMNGLQCLEKIKEDHDLCEIPAFIYTTCHDASLRRKAKTAGAEACIRKPLLPKIMAQMLLALHATGNPEFIDGKKI